MSGLGDVRDESIDRFGGGVDPKTLPDGGQTRSGETGFHRLLHDRPDGVVGDHKGGGAKLREVCTQLIDGVFALHVPARAGQYLERLTVHGDLSSVFMKTSRLR